MKIFNANNNTRFHGFIDGYYCGFRFEFVTADGNTHLSSCDYCETRKQAQTRLDSLFDAGEYTGRVIFTGYYTSGWFKNDDGEWLEGFHEIDLEHLEWMVWA